MQPTSLSGLLSKNSSSKVTHHLVLAGLGNLAHLTGPPMVGLCLRDLQWMTSQLGSTSATSTSRLSVAPRSSAVMAKSAT